MVEEVNWTLQFYSLAKRTASVVHDFFEAALTKSAGSRLPQRDCPVRPGGAASWSGRGGPLGCVAPCSSLVIRRLSFVAFHIVVYNSIRKEKARMHRESSNGRAFQERARPSAREKHEMGQARLKKDKEKTEKGDKRRKNAPRKRQRPPKEGG